MHRYLISYSLYFALHIEILDNIKWAKNIININIKGILSHLKDTTELPEYMDMSYDIIRSFFSAA